MMSSCVKSFIWKWVFLHENETVGGHSFIMNWMVLGKTRLEPMAKGNSEIAYSSLIHIGAQNMKEEYCKIVCIRYQYSACTI